MTNITKNKRLHRLAAESYANYRDAEKKEIAVDAFMAGCRWMATQIEQERYEAESAAMFKDNNPGKYDLVSNNID